MKEFTEISSKDNKIIRLVNSIKTSAKERRETGSFILEGVRICSDALENNIAFKSLLVSESGMKKYKDEVLKFSQISEKCYLLKDSVFEKISDTKTPQGVIAVGDIPNSRNALKKAGRFIALENLQDPANLGAVARTAEALGVSGIVLTNNGCDPYSPKALRASMGTLLRVPLFFCEDIITFAKQNGLRTVACIVDRTAADIKDFKFENNDILLIGNEGNGLLEKTVSASDFSVTVKMSGSAESLNAAAAAAIVMWEMTK